MVRAKNVGDAAKAQKQPRSLAQALKHPEVGPEGIVPWLITDPNGVLVMQATGGGGSYVKEERDLALGAILKDHPDLTADDPTVVARLDAKEAQFVLGGALKMLEKMTTPEQFAAIKLASPQFFKEEGPKEVAIVSDKRMGPETRAQHVDVWEGHAKTHIEKWFKDAGNSGNIEDAIAEMEDWLRAAIYRETDEPVLAAATMARGEGTKRLAKEILEQVPELIRKWWASEEGSGIAKELNPKAAGLYEAAGRRSGGRRQRGIARSILRDQKKKREKGLGL